MIKYDIIIQICINQHKLWQIIHDNQISNKVLLNIIYMYIYYMYLFICLEKFKNIKKKLIPE